VRAAAPPLDQRVWKLGLGLAAMVLALYWRGLSNQFVFFDDGPYVYTNDHVKAGLTLDGLRWALRDLSTGNWHPLTWLSHMLDVQLFGLNPGAHHLVSALWHAANAAVLLVVLWMMTRRLWRSAWVAALFAVHPLRVESVAWVAERKDVLSGFFYLCIVGAYAWYTQRPRSWRRYAAVAALLLLGLMAKPSVVTAPFLLLLLDYWPLRRQEPMAVLVREKIPLFALAAAVSVATYLSQSQVGATTTIGHVTLSQRLANVVVSYARYLGKIVWPHPLAVMYPFNRALPVLWIAGSCLLLAAITALVIWRGRSQRYLPVGWFWFLGTMAPMVGIVQVGWQAYADRYTYIPCIGIFIALVWAAADSLEGRRWERGASILAAVALLPPLAFATWSQLPYWHDGMALFQHAIEVTPANPLAQYQLGNHLVDLGSNAAAMPHLREMIRLEPSFYAAYYSLGKAQSSDGQKDAAFRNFTEALRLKPDYADAYYARAILMFQSGDIPAAEGDFRSALKYGLSAEWAADAHNGLGVILGQGNDHAAALEQFEQAVQLRPDLVEAQRNLAYALIGQGRTGEAAARLKQAFSATHGDPTIGKMLDGLQARN